jgi:uncharacterized protein HemX
MDRNDAMRALLIISAALAVATGVLGWQLLRSHERVGEYRQAAETATAIAKANEVAYNAAIASKDEQIKELKRARELSEKAASESLKRERAAYERIGRVENTLKEAIANDPQSTEWGSVRVPDAVIDGMQRSAAAAIDGAPR